MKKNLLICFTLISFSCFWISAAENGKYPSLTDVGPYETPSRYASVSISYNLGPTGARGWARSFNGGKHFWEEDGWEILITHVLPNTPADGKLQVFDVLVGADGKIFDNDALESLGNAIAKAQRGNGKLALKVWSPATGLPSSDLRAGRTRKGKISDVTLQLPMLPGDSVDAPIVVEDSKALRKQFSNFLATNMPPDGFRFHPTYSALNALYLLANGKIEDLELVRRHIQRIVNDKVNSKADDKGKKDYEKHGPWNWAKGPNTVLLAEYFFKTGDKSVLPAIKQNMEWMRNCQSYAGGYSHNAYGGYGHVGLPGMFNSTGAVLGRECGVTGYDDIIEKASKFYARPAGLGMISYGGETAGKNLKTLYGDNGKCGSAAVFYGVLGNKEMSRTFANTACTLAPYSESGHTGHFWSMSWGAMGANLGDLPNRKYFAKELDWYYALARTSRGGMTIQPWLANVWSYVPGGEDLATGGMALWYCTPLKSLRILGGEKSVLTQDLAKPLADARDLIYDKNYNGCITALDKFKPADDKQKKQAEELKKIAERGLKTIELTLKSIRANIDKGDLYLAERQLFSLKPILKDKDTIKELDEFFNADKNKAIIDAGKQYYGVMTYQASPDREFFYRAPQIVFNPKKRKELKKIAESNTSGVYAKMAADALKCWKADFSPKYKTLIEKEITFDSPYLMYVGKEPDAKKGIHYKYGEFNTYPKSAQSIRKRKTFKEGTVQTFDLSPKRRRDNFFFKFNTFVEIPKEGEYKFTITSDDGSYLYLDGKEVIDNGGIHKKMTPKSGSIRLTKGRHKLEILMFQNEKRMGLKVEMELLSKDSIFKPREIPFEIKDPQKMQQLQLSVEASDPVDIYLNGEVICRFHKKRRKRVFDDSWKKWEVVTLRPEALKLLKAGNNVLGVTVKTSSLDANNVKIGIKLLGLEKSTPQP